VYVCERESERRGGREKGPHKVCIYIYIYIYIYTNISYIYIYIYSYIHTWKNTHIVTQQDLFGLIGSTHSHVRCMSRSYVM